MKSRTLKDMTRELRKEVDRENAKHQYKIYLESVDTMFQAAATAMIAVMCRRGLSKKYIQKFFDDFIGILEFPEIFGKELRSDELQKRFEKEYGIDFSRIHVKIESEEEFLHREKIR